MIRVLYVDVKKVGKVKNRMRLFDEEPEVMYSSNVCIERKLGDERERMLSIYVEAKFSDKPEE
jgi:uncharacterized membrane protein (DUF106 family)